MYRSLGERNMMLLPQKDLLKLKSNTSYCSHTSLVE